MSKRRNILWVFLFLFFSQTAPSDARAEDTDKIARALSQALAKDVSGNSNLLPYMVQVGRTNEDLAKEEYLTFKGVCTDRGPSCLWLSNTSENLAKKGVALDLQTANTRACEYGKNCQAAIAIRRAMKIPRDVNSTMTLESVVRQYTTDIRSPRDKDSTFISRHHFQYVFDEAGKPVAAKRIEKDADTPMAVNQPEVIKKCLKAMGYPWACNNNRYVLHKIDEHTYALISTQMESEPFKSLNTYTENGRRGSTNTVTFVPEQIQNSFDGGVGISVIREERDGFYIYDSNLYHTRSTAVADQVKNNMSTFEDLARRENESLKKRLPKTATEVAGLGQSSCTAGTPDRLPAVETQTALGRAN